MNPRVEAERVETASCSDVGEADVRSGPLSKRSRIEAVEALHQSDTPKSVVHTRGALVYLAAEPGLTEQWLTRVARCHALFHAAAGPNVDDAPCPLAVPGVEPLARGTAAGFALELRSEDDDDAHRILDLARALVREGAAAAR